MSIKYNFFATLLLLSFFLSGITAHAHQPHDVISALDISPSYDTDATLFAVFDSTDLARSTDGGNSWKILNNGLDNTSYFSFVTISPFFDKDGTIFVGTEGDGVYKSTDRGESWEKKNTGLPSLNIRLLICSPDFASDRSVVAVLGDGYLCKTTTGGDKWIPLVKTTKTITSAAFSPYFLIDKTILAGDSKGNLYSYNDADKSWSKLCVISPGKAITSICYSPAYYSDGMIFIGVFGGGVFRSINRGLSFAQINKGLSDLRVTSIAISRTFRADSTLFACGSEKAVFKSNNRGDSWAKSSRGITYSEQGNIHYRFLKISNNFIKDRTIFLGAFEGLFKSQHSGRFWFQLETQSVRNITDVDLSPDYFNDSSIFYSTYGGGLYKSQDGGLTWTINNIGLERPFLYNVKFSPGYMFDDTVFAIQYGYLLKSLNAGARWDQYRISEEKDIVPNTLLISPDFINDGTVYMGTRRDGVLCSYDGGETWFTVLSDVTIASMAISPDYAFDGTVYIGTRDSGVIKTDDWGVTWKSVNNGLTTPEWIILSISPSYGSDGTLYAGTRNGIFMTTNGGESWAKLPGDSRIENGFIQAIGISPNFSADNMLIISVKGNGLFRTSDRGLHWEEICPDLLENNYSLKEILFSPSFNRDNTLYGRSGYELFQSTDRGNQWSIIKRPSRYENTSEFISYYQSWLVQKDENASTGSLSFSNNIKDIAALRFTGTGVAWIGTKSVDQGIAEVFIDGVSMGKVDQYANQTKYLETLYSIEHLSFGNHNIVLVVTGQKNVASQGYYTVIDAFDIMP
jgi:photosystem II stability/assembly factor-like uncharacterized protein